MNEATNLEIIGNGIVAIGDILLTFIAEMESKQNDDHDNNDNINNNNFIDKPNNIINKYIKDIANINVDFSTSSLGDLNVIGNALVLIGDLLSTGAAIDKANTASDINAQVSLLNLIDSFFSVIGDIAGLEAALLSNEK